MKTDFLTNAPGEGREKIEEARQLAVYAREVVNRVLTDEEKQEKLIADFAGLCAVFLLKDCTTESEREEIKARVTRLSDLVRESVVKAHIEGEGDLENEPWERSNFLAIDFAVGSKENLLVRVREKLTTLLREDARAEIAYTLLI